MFFKYSVIKCFIRGELPTSRDIKNFKMIMIIDVYEFEMTMTEKFLNKQTVFINIDQLITLN